MSEEKIYPVPAEVAANAHIDAAAYEAMYKRSIDDPDGFWAEQADKFVTWFKRWDKVSDWSFDADNLYIKWFEGAQLNVSYNCLDRHLDTRGDQTAIIWEGDDPGVDKRIINVFVHHLQRATKLKSTNSICIQGVGFA